MNNITTLTKLIESEFELRLRHNSIWGVIECDDLIMYPSTIGVDNIFVADHVTYVDCNESHTLLTSKLLPILACYSDVYNIEQHHTYYISLNIVERSLSVWRFNVKKSRYHKIIVIMLTTDMEKYTQPFITNKYTHPHIYVMSS